MAAIERTLVRRQFKSSQQDGMAAYDAAKRQLIGGNAFTAPVYTNER